MRVMVDANVLVAGSVFPRWPYEVLRHALRGDFELVLCPLVVEEARRALQRVFPDHLPLFDAFLLLCPYEAVSDPTPEEVVQNDGLVRDPSDIPVALAAINAKVDYLVSNDKDLTAEDESTERLRQLVRPIQVGTFLKEVMGWKDNELEKIRRRNW